MHGMYATVNVASKSSANLRFTFHDWHTKQPVVMDDFTITFFDLDHGYGNAGVEEVVIQGDWTQAVVAEDTTILVHQAESSEHKIAFKATEEALRPDEPKNPLHLTLRQFNKAVSLKFVRAKSFTADLKVTTTSQYPRFFEFLGEASILCASNPNGGKLPSGEVYVNRAQLEKTDGNPALPRGKEPRGAWVIKHSTYPVGAGRGCSVDTYRPLLLVCRASEPARLR